MQDGTAFLPNSSLAGNGLLVSDGDVRSLQCTSLHAQPRETQHPDVRWTSASADTCDSLRRAAFHLSCGRVLRANTQVWRSQRQLSNPAFRRAAVASYGAAMAAGAQRLVEGWKGRRHAGTVDVFRDYNELVRVYRDHNEVVRMTRSLRQLRADHRHTAHVTVQQRAGCPALILQCGEYSHRGCRLARCADAADHDDGAVRR